MGATNTTKTTLWSVHKGDTFTLEVPRWLYDSFWWWECVQSTELPVQLMGTCNGVLAAFFDNRNE